MPYIPFGCLDLYINANNKSFLWDVINYLVSFSTVSALGGSNSLRIPVFPNDGCLFTYVPQVCELLENMVSHRITLKQFSLHSCGLLYIAYLNQMFANYMNIGV